MIEKNIELKRDKVTLSGILFIPETKRKNPAIIVAHGLPNTALPVQKKGYDSLGRKICALGAVSIVFNFSGCQGAGGYFSISNWVKDLELVSNYIFNLEEVNPSRMGFLAFSMGTIPTIYFIAHLDKSNTNYPKILIICASPAALSDKRLRELRLGIHLTAKAGGIRITEEYDQEMISEFKEHLPIVWIDSISAPKFILHGAKDDLINVENAYKLYEKAKEPKKLIILKESKHRLRQDETAMKKILELIVNFLEK